MAVRARRLFGPVPGADIAGGVTVYTVPAGRTAVIRGLVVTNGSGVSETTVHLFLDTGAGGVFLWAPQPLANAATVVFPAYMVLNPGDVLRFRVGPQPIACTITGFGSLLLGAPE